MVYANAVNFRYKKREFRTFLVIPRNRVENIQKKTTPFCQSRHNLIAVLVEWCRKEKGYKTRSRILYLSLKNSPSISFFIRSQIIPVRC